MGGLAFIFDKENKPCEGPWKAINQGVGVGGGE